MRLVFYGTSDFAVPALRAIHAAGHSVAAVVTAPRKPSGRGRRLVPSPVEAASREMNLVILTPEDPNHDESPSQLAGFAPDIGVLVAYGFILHQRLLDIPARGFVNLHPSLLPAYRGAAPIQRAVMAGESRTGVTVIAMSRAVDAGDIIAQQSVDIGTEETAGELSARLAEAGAQLLVEVLAQLASGGVPRSPQDPCLATRAAKISAADRHLDWREPASSIHNRIRALSPEPGAFAVFRGRRLLLLRSRVIAAGSTAAPGTILVDHPSLIVRAGTDVIELLEVKPEGGKVQSGRAFRNGHRPTPGEMVN